MNAIDIDLELARWVLDYLREKGSVLEAELVREFFPDDPATARAHLDFLKNGRAIYRQGQTWFPIKATEVSARAQECETSHQDCSHPSTQYERQRCRRKRGQVKGAAPALARDLHKGCVHPDTKSERQKCRYGYYKPGTLERASSAAQILKAVKPKPVPKPKRVPKPKSEPRPQRTPEEVRAQKKRWNKQGALTAPKLAHFIYARMKHDRDKRYVFDMEWVRSHYPHLVDTRPDLVRDALQHLVNKGRISALPK